MTAEQVKYLREQLAKDTGEGKAVATSMFYDFDNGMAFRTSNDFIIFDEEHELVHCIAANRNNYVKDETPYCMYTAGFEQLQYTEANLTLDGLKTVVETTFADMLDETQKKQIIDWALSLPVNPISVVVSSYHREANPDVNYKPLTVVSRPDGVHNGYPVTNLPKEPPIKTTNAAKATESISALDEGATLSISGTTPIEEPLTISTDNVTIIGKDLPIDNSTTITGENVTMKGITFSNTKLTSGDKASHILNINGENFTMENCLVTNDSSVTTRNAISATAKCFTVKDCTFDGDLGVYNCIESAYNVAQCEKIRFENCVFKPGAATNNFVSLYDFVDGAEIVFDNCTFNCGPNTNAVRFSNLKNTHANVLFNNCKYGTVADGDYLYAGMLLFQDSSSDKSQDMSLISVKFVNLSTLDGKLIKENGTGVNRIWYTYNTDTVPNIVFA